MFRAVLDTCVLWPSLQRDVLLSFAVARLYRPLWSEQILEELRFGEQLKLQDRGVPSAEARARTSRLVLAMREMFSDALVSADSDVSNVYGLPDPNDEHVVAAAESGGAGVIVTNNLRDFPASLMPLDIEVKHPIDFFADTVDFGPEIAVQAIERMLARYRRPVLSFDACLMELRRRYGHDEACEQLFETRRQMRS